MGFDDSEIAYLKQRVPERFRPDAVNGALSLEFERHQQGLAFIAQDSDTDSPGFLLTGGLETIRRQRLGETTERKRREQTRTVLTILDQATAWSRQLGTKIDRLEAEFEAEHGDAWREDLANRIMDADEIPQRREGESMQDYRERLEEVLIEKMIDPATGRIKLEYRDDPQLRRYAEWAQARFQKREVDFYIARSSDPTLSQAERDQMDRDFTDTATFDALRQSESAGHRSNSAPNRISAAIDEHRNAATSDATSESSAFGPGS